MIHLWWLIFSNILWLWILTTYWPLIHGVTLQAPIQKWIGGPEDLSFSGLDYQEPLQVKNKPTRIDDPERS